MRIQYRFTLANGTERRFALTLDDASLALVPSAVLLAVRLACHAALRPTYAGAGGAYWLAPLADGLAVIRLIASALRPNRRWRGRTYATSA